LFKPPAEEEAGQEEEEEAGGQTGALGAAGTGDFPAGGMGTGTGMGGGGIPSGLGDFFSSVGGRTNTPVGRRGVSR